MWGFLLLLSLPLCAQRHEILNDRIATLQVTPGSDWMSLPIIKLGQRINISFDDLTHEYHRYVYRIEHCESDWTVSEDIFTTDFVEGFNDSQPLEDLEESLNTNVLYTHYRLQIPNQHCRLKMSGNYRVTIYDENDDDQAPVLTVCFMVVEPRMSVAMTTI